MKDDFDHVPVKHSTKTALKRYKRKIRKCKSIDDVIGVLMKGYEKSREKVEINKPMLTQDGELEKSVPCLSRFDFEEMYYCGKSAPKIVPLPTLKICDVCRFRITEEGLAELKERENVKTTYYLQCGAKEKYDEEAGLFVFSSRCPSNELRNRWHGVSYCQRIQCPMIKSVVGVVKKK